MTQSAPAPPPGDPAPTPPLTPVPAPPPTPPAPADPPSTDEPLGPAGKKALDEERAARKALEKQVAELAPLQRLAAALGGSTPAAGGKSEVELITERLDGYEQSLADERAGRWRAEIAHEKGLTPAQAARLQGATREELASDADALVALFPAAVVKPGTPAADPSQGSRGGQPADLDAQIREAQGKGDWKTALRLQNQKLANAK